MKKSCRCGAGFSIVCRSFLPDQLVGFRIREYHPGLEGFGFFEIQQGVGGDDYDVAHLHLACGRAVQTDRTAAPLSFDNLGFEAFAVIDVQYLYFFAFDHVGRIHQLFVDGDAAHVVQVGLRDRVFC